MRIPHEVPVAVGRQFILLDAEVAAAILLTLQAGWARALLSPEVHVGADEVPITERLRDGMRNALGTLPWGKTMIIAPGTESRSRATLARPDGRTDIPIFLIEVFVRYGEHDPHAIIECKRIAGTEARLCREYVVEGIDRFRTAKYSENHAAGFMVGYVISGDAAEAVAGVNAYLDGQNREAEHLASSDLVPRPGIWRSRHARTDRLPIDVHHSFLLIAFGH